jgi:Mg-chelatase subunit ChlD
VDSQQKNGSWKNTAASNEADPRVPTSYALLFLTRGTPTLKPTTRPVAGRRIIAATKPVITTEPVVISLSAPATRPALATKPIVVAKPAAATKPVVVSQPVVVAKPVIVSQPVVVAKPVAATRPAPIAQPVVPPKPVVEARPVVVPKPAPPAAPQPVVRHDGVLKTVASAAPAQKYYIILDASGSMSLLMDGKRKFDIARDAVASFINEMPAASQVALRVYGHRKGVADAGASEDTALEIPMAPLDRKRFLDKLNSLRSRGRTPLALSIRQTAADLARETQPVTVILLTDGIEDTTPRQDPRKAADQLAALKNVKVLVVGFDIGRPDWHEELADITRHAGGEYWPANKAEQLRAHLRARVLGGPEDFVILDKDRRAIDRGSFGGSKSLPEGTYLLRTAMGNTFYEKQFTIAHDATTTVAFADTQPVKPAPISPTASREAPASAQARSPRRFCNQCGRPVDREAKFCTECGAKAAP